MRLNRRPFIGRQIFLSEVFSGCEGHIEIRILPEGVQGFFPIDDPKGMDAFVSKHIERNIFFGVATRNGHGGTKADIVDIPGVWVDIDFKDTSREKADKLLSECPLQPTFIVESGGGYHGYWLFKEPEQDIEVIELINRQLQGYFGSDSVYNADRILRLPLTFNHKYTPKRHVKILKYNPANRYNPIDFEKNLPPVQANKAGQPANVPGWQSELLKGVDEGERDKDATKLAGREFGKGRSPEEVLIFLRGWNQGNLPPLDDSDLVKVVRSIERAEKRKTPKIHNTTDLGNAERFAEQFGNRIRFNWTTGQFLYYDGVRWNAHTGKSVARKFAYKVARDILKEADAVTDLEKRKRLANWSFASESTRGIHGTLELAKALDPVDCYSEQFDTDQFLLNLKNGTLDLRTGNLRDHDPGDMISKLAPMTWNGEVSSLDGDQLWLRCCVRWMKDEQDAIDYLQRLGGMCLTGDITSRVFPIFWGTGKNGKNVFLDTLLGILGDYGMAAPRTLLTESYTEEHATEIAGLVGMRLVVASESKAGRKLKTSLVKQMTGDSKIRGRFMRQDYFDFDITHKTVLMTQNLPVIDEVTDAIWDRVHKIEWGVRIPDDEQDHQLLKKLKREWPQILGWFVEGCLKWQADGYLKPTEEIIKGTLEYRADMNPLKDFKTECCILGEDEFVGMRILKEAFNGWNPEKKVMGSRTFAALMRSSGYIDRLKRVDGKPLKCWMGLRLRDNYDQ